jgi:ribulose-5-phosphate 4-epimerase/fuculose-1-phosphate aldolase
MHASCFLKLDLEGNVLFNPTEMGLNVAGYAIHSAFHRARPHVDCVIHTHTIAGMAASAMKRGLPPIARTSMRFAKIAYHDYEGVAVNVAKQQRLVRDLGDDTGMNLRNHGLLVVAPSIAEAFNSMFRLKRACQVQVTALSCNVELQLPPPKIVEASFRIYLPQTRRPFVILEWPALLRKLDQLDPSYRE